MSYALIVEDHDDTRAWWLEALPRLFPDTEAHAVATLQAARDRLSQHHYWLAIVDISLPDGSGVDLIADISACCPDTRCVVCTIFDDDQHVFSALHAGARGYLVKDQPRERQLAQLREILHGQPPLSPGVAQRILRYLVEQPDSSLPAGRADGEAAAVPDAHLTEREIEVLRLIAKGYSRPEVAAMLDLSLNTVAGYTKSIYQKLGISRRAEAVVEAMRLGLVKPE